MSVSTVRSLFRGWMNQGKLSFLTTPVHKVWRAGVNLRGMSLRGKVICETHTVPAYSGDPTELDRISQLIHDGFEGLIFSMQQPSEIKRLLQKVHELRPTRILEIGTALGGTLFALSRVVDPNALIVSLDLPGGLWGGGYPAWKSKLYQGMVQKTQTLHLLRDDSHRLESLQRVREILGNDQLDFLFIDGDHTYEGVKQDFQMYHSLVRPGGLIGFHDIAEHPDQSGGEVPRFWRELRETRQVEEFVENWNGGYGIGLVRV